MSRCDATIREAQNLAVRLDREKRKHDAEIIRSLIRSLSCSRETSRRLLRDNVELRKWSPENNG